MSEVQTHSGYTIPIGYNDNKISLLVKDSNWLYAYWKISNAKKGKFFDEFGNELWDRSVPVLKLINISKNTSFFVRVNEFSNSWFIHVPDSDCLYSAEIGRKVTNEFFINLASSNYITTPSNSISQNNSAYFINYTDLKKGKINVESNSIFETLNSETSSVNIFGISSLELFGTNRQKSVFGMSSSELLGIGLSSER